MRDRELLERAAKAAGMTWSTTLYSDKLTGLPLEHNGHGHITYWNPLTDDGDALRLAVKLYLWEAVRLAHRLVGEENCPDIYAATRRAIVRAAAAMTSEQDSPEPNEGAA